MTMIARGWLVLDMTDSAFLVTAVNAVGMLPMLVFSLYGGVIVDRMNRRLVLITSDVFSFIVIAALAVLVITTRWKISIHAIGISAPLMILHMAYGNIVWVWWSLVPLVAGSRVVLQKHTLAQVTTGAALGIIMTFVQVNLFFM